MDFFHNTILKIPTSVWKYKRRLNEPHEKSKNNWMLLRKNNMKILALRNARRKANAAENRASSTRRVISIINELRGLTSVFVYVGNELPSVRRPRYTFRCPGWVLLPTFSIATMVYCRVPRLLVRKFNDVSKIYIFFIINFFLSVRLWKIWFIIIWGVMCVKWYKR